MILSSPPISILPCLPSFVVFPCSSPGSGSPKLSLLRLPRPPLHPHRHHQSHAEDAGSQSYRPHQRLGCLISGPRLSASISCLSPTPDSCHLQAIAALVFQMGKLHAHPCTTLAPRSQPPCDTLSRDCLTLSLAHPLSLTHDERGRVKTGDGQGWERWYHAR